MSVLLIPRIVFLPHYREGCTRPAHSQNEWKWIRISCGQRCFYCAEVVPDGEATKDHLIPLFRGGCDCVVNLVEACVRCNCMKKEMTVAEFLEAKRALVETVMQFPTTASLLEETMPRKNDTLLAAIARLADKKRMEPARLHPNQLKAQLRRRA